MEPENWALVDIADGTYYIAEYIGVLDKAGRSDEETEAVKAFAEWFGSADVQAAWGEEFDSYPCNQEAANILYPDGVPEIYTLKNFALTKVDGDTTYAEYVANHSSEWTNIMTNLGFYWADASSAASEPDWDSLDWATLTQSMADTVSIHAVRRQIPFCRRLHRGAGRFYAPHPCSSQERRTNFEREERLL